jgi:hypothetical protein
VSRDFLILRYHATKRAVYDFCAAARPEAGGWMTARADSGPALVRRQATISDAAHCVGRAISYLKR